MRFSAERQGPGVNASAELRATFCRPSCPTRTDFSDSPTTAWPPTGAKGRSYCLIARELDLSKNTVVEVVKGSRNQAPLSSRTSHSHIRRAMSCSSAPTASA
jgi:hypothetical protein